MDKQTVPLYYGDSNDPNRRVIGSADVDMDTMTATAYLDDENEAPERESIPEDEWPHGMKRGDRVQRALLGGPITEGRIRDVTRLVGDASGGFNVEIDPL